MQTWISVKDKLPEDGEVLCYGHGEYLVGSLYELYGKYNCEADDTMIENVTHWMPLPEPPKEK